MTSHTLFLRNQGIWCRLAMMWLAALVSTTAAPPHISQAQVPPITPSGLLTQVSAPITVPGGTQYTITGGTRPGAGPNLFHSFGQFGVPTANIANFLNETALPTTNILGRVTGGSPSNIFGTIQTSDFGSANLFLMNPAGILFGPNATLNIGGMATFTTADSLKLADGTVFHAAPNAAADALLSIAPVASFGFLGPRSGPITVDHSTLQVPEGKGLALVGGAIRIEGGRLVAKGAPVELTGRESVVVSGTGQLGPRRVARGASPESIVMANVSQEHPTGIFNSTDSSGTRGDVTLSAPTIRLENGVTIESTANTGSAGRITLQGFEGRPATNIALDNATVNTTISGGSPASTPANITFTADTVTLSNATLITANTHGSAPAGDITLNANTLTTKGGVNRLFVNPGDPSWQTGGMIESGSRSFDAGAGKAGHITIQGIKGPGSAARSVSVDDSMMSTAIFGGTAATTPSTISITADTVSLSNGAYIFTTTNGAAPGGDITLNVNTLRANEHPDGTLIEDAEFVTIDTLSTTSQSTAGPAGSLTISGPGPGSTDAATLVALNRTEFDAIVFGGTANTHAGAITITADSVSLSNLTVMVATSWGDAPAGAIAINAGTLRVNVSPDGTPMEGADGVFLLTPSRSSEPTRGRGGSITISGPGPESTDAATLVALDKTEITAEVSGGTAGTLPSAITITADTVTLTSVMGDEGFETNIGETRILASSNGPAPAGNIAFHINTLRANVNPDGTPMEHGYVVVASTSNSPNDTAGPAGTVTISGPGPASTDAASLLALNNFAINTDVNGGRAGTAPSTITITAGTVAFNGRVLSDVRGIRTGIFSASGGGAPAGTIAANVETLSTNNTIFSSSSSSAAMNAGNAGSVTIQGIAGAGSLPAAVALNHSNITTEADAGAGGAIALASSTDIMLADATISATVTGGSQPGGNITLSAGNRMMLTDGSVISAQSTGLGDAGNILISAGQNYTSINSAVTTEAAQASGGNITVTAPGMIQLTNSQINASVQGSTTTVGGNIMIDPQFVILQNSQILAQATQGQGGNISITTNALVPDATSLVDASSQFGVSGTVRIQSPNAPAAGKIVPLSQTPLPATALLGVRCAALEGGQYSSFVVAGHYGVPTEPGGWLASPLAALSADAGQGPRGEEQEGTYTVSSLKNVTEILSLRGLPSSKTVANILTNWTADCGS